MRSQRTMVPAVAVLLLAVPLASCTITTSSGTRPDDAKFLEALSGDPRDKYPDSTLLQEGQKVCDALAKGQSEDQVRQMISADLDVDAGQFLGALDAGNMCADKGGS